MAKIYLKSAYRSVGIHPSQYQFAGLQWHFEGQSAPTYMVDTRLMFGASQAVGIFHRLSNSIVRMVKRRKLIGNVVNYLDDFLVIAPTKYQCQLLMDEVLKLIVSLGFDINWQKVVYPAQVVTFLGIEINSVTSYLSIPASKLAEIKSKLLLWVGKKSTTKHELQSLAGTIAWGAKCIRAVRPILRNIIDLYKGLKLPSHHVHLPSCIKSDVLFFLSGVQSLMACPLLIIKGHSLLPLYALMPFCSLGLLIITLTLCMLTGISMLPA